MTAVVRPAIVRLWFPLFYVLMFSSLYVYAWHAPSPHHVPVAVVGASAQTHRLAERLDARTGPAFDVRTVRTPGAARRAVYDWTLTGAYDPSPGRPTLYVATMAAPSGASAVEQLFRSVGSNPSEQLRVVDLAPPPAGDPRGISLFYLIIAWTISGFLAGVMLNISFGAIGVWTNVGIVAGFAVLTSAVSYLVAGLGIGALPVSAAQGLQLVGIGWLQTFTVAVVGLGLRNILGMLATNAVVAGIFIFLDFPAAGDAVAPHLLPPFFRYLNAVMPAAAVTRAARAVLYFGGVNAVEQLPVLLAWPAAGLVFFVLARRFFRLQPSTG